ncbi:hypothetical protein B7494_g4006 [Chlorociboria aeruginascens]|nr:hypothetical protein B7494_g4006 [Chlorociboria aeruginascens]
MNTAQSPVMMDVGFENLLYEEIQRAIYRENCETGDIEECRLRPLEDFPFKLIEIWIYKEGEEIGLSVNPYDDLKTREVQEYLRDEKDPFPEGTVILGGLRLLIQEWPRTWAPSKEDGSQGSASSTRGSEELNQEASTDSFVSWLRVKHQWGDPGILPFSKYTLDLMTKKFSLPQSYPNDLLGDVPIPLRCTSLDTGSIKEEGDSPDKPENIKGFVLQSPKYEDERTFVSNVLSYDPVKNITSGFLGYVKDESQNSPGRVMENILLSLKSDYFAPSAAHPLLIPSLILNCWFTLNKSKIDTSNLELKNAKKKLQLIKYDEDRNGDNYVSNINLKTKQYEYLSNSIINTRQLLTENSTFSETLCKNCLDSLAALSTHSGIPDPQGKKLRAFLLYLKGDIAAYDHYRESLVSYTQVSLNDLSNFTHIYLQQYYGEASRHMEESKRRGNAISVAVSFLSASFLPATVIATIFGMVEFFTVEDGQLQTSPTWTIYWKWTGGITGGFLLVWLILVLTYSGLGSWFIMYLRRQLIPRKRNPFSLPSIWPNAFQKTQNKYFVASPATSVSPDSSYSRQPIPPTLPNIPAHGDIEKQSMHDQDEPYNYNSSPSTRKTRIKWSRSRQFHHRTCLPVCTRKRELFTPAWDPSFCFFGYSTNVTNMSEPRPVRQSVREIDDNTWIIGDMLLLSHTTVEPLSGCFWSDGHNAFYILSEPDLSKFQTRPLSTTSRVQLIYDAGEYNATWRIGEAFLKVHALSTASRTLEHITLNYLHDPANGFIPTFPIPCVLYHKEYDNRYYLFTSRVLGDPLEKAWLSMNEATKQACVEQVVEIIKWLMQKKSNKICSIDGGGLSETWLKPPYISDTSDGYSHETLFQYCKELKMNSDVFVLYHCDMGPTNIIVDLTNGCKVGLIDWEVTGFVPKEWIRTKFCVCWGMDLNIPDNIMSQDWRQRVQLQLAQEGFTEVAKAWKSRFSKRVQEFMCNGIACDRSASSKTEIVQPLLPFGLEISARCGDYYNAFVAAVMDSTEGTVRLLLDKGAEVNADKGAGIDGHGDDKGANSNNHGNDRGTPLQEARDAADKYDTSVVIELPLDRGISSKYYCRKALEVMLRSLQKGRDQRVEDGPTVSLFDLDGEPSEQPPYPQDQYGQTMGRDDYDGGDNVEMASLTQNGSEPAQQNNSILTKCGEIRSRLDIIDARLVNELVPSQSKALNNNPTAEKKLEALHTSLMAEYRKLTGELAVIKGQPESTSYMNVSAVGMVERKLNASSKKYALLDRDFQQQVRNGLTRQMRIVHPEMSEAEISEAVDNNGDQPIFAQKVMQGNRQGEATTTLNSVTSRHNEIKNIEKQIEELATLFTQVNEMVEQQDEAVTNIEMKGEEVVENMDKGTEEIGVAVKTARSTRKKKWWCLGICVAIIIIIVIIILIYIFVIKGTGKTTSNNKRFLLNDIIMKSVPVLPNVPWTPKRAIDLTA